MRATRLVGGVLALVLVVLIATGYLKRAAGFSSYEEIYSRRYIKARDASTALIAVVYAEGEDELYLGAELAFADRSVTVGNRKLDVKLVPYKTGNSIRVKDQLAIARKIARDDNYVAVLGHSTSEVASLASVSYEYTKLLYIATTATDPALTTHGFGYTFRTIGTDEQSASVVALLCAHLKVKRLGTFYEQTSHATRAIDSLQGALEEHSIATVFEKPYESLLGSGLGGEFERRQRQARLRDQIAGVEHLAARERPDIIALVGDGVQSAVRVWQALASSAFRDVPIVIFGGPLDANEFIDNTRRRGDGHQSSVPVLLNLANPPDYVLENRAIYVATMFSAAEIDEPVPPSPSPLHDDVQKRLTELRNFNTAYRRRYGNLPEPALRYPEALAFRGYTAADILKQAMEHSVSVAPVDLQQTLKSTKKFKSLGRLFSFETNGNRIVERLGAPDMPLLFKKFSAAAQ